jgi:hypothetical protein
MHQKNESEETWLDCLEFRLAYAYFPESASRALEE